MKVVIKNYNEEGCKVAIKEVYIGHVLMSIEQFGGGGGLNIAQPEVHLSIYSTMSVCSVYSTNECARH